MARKINTRRDRKRRQYQEQLAVRRMLTTEFHMLALVYPDIVDSGTLLSNDDATVQAIVDGVQLELPTLVKQLTGDQIQVRVHVEVVNRVIQMRPDGLAFDSQIEPELSAFTKSGWYDHVFVLHASRNGGFGGACCAFPRPGMTMSTIGMDSADVPGMLHEWMHALDSYYFDARGVFSGTDPAGDPLRLHSAEAFGYSSDTENRWGWSEWYGDYLTDNIRNLHSNGANTGRGLGPDAWTLGAPRDSVTRLPGSPLALPEVSSSSPAFLSDIYWASATKANEWVRHL